jgi:hypothetical protein
VGHHELVCPQCGKRVGGCRCIEGGRSKVKDTKPCKECQQSTGQTVASASLAYEVKRLQEAIRTHRDARGDDRCWLDDQALYAALPEGTQPNTTLPPEEKFLANCRRFWQARQNPGCPYETEEDRRRALDAELREAKIERAQLRIAATKRVEAHPFRDAGGYRVGECGDCCMEPDGLPHRADTLEATIEQAAGIVGNMLNYIGGAGIKNDVLRGHVLGLREVLSNSKVIRS